MPTSSNATKTSAPVLAIRPGVRADAPELYRLFKASILATEGETPYTRQQLEAWIGRLAYAELERRLDDPDEPFFVGDAPDSVILGFTAAKADELTLAFSHPLHAGVGRPLVARALEYIQAQGHAVARTTSSFNAIRFYESMGFEGVAEGLCKKTGDVKIPVLDMELSFAREPRFF